MIPPEPLRPAYGAGSLAEVLPSVLAALGSGATNHLALPPARAVVLFVVDGLGWELLHAAAGEAPFLAGRRPSARSITSGYPSSTATSLAMLSTSCPPIAHGLTGYTMAAPGLGRAMNNLAWATHGPNPVDLRSRLPPEEIQPLPTALERARSAGVSMTAVGPADHVGSGLTQAILRGGPYVPVAAGDDDALLAAVSRALAADGPRAVYAYDPSVDAAGHRHGPGSAPWRSALRRIDRIAAGLHAGLPPGGVLAVTADHGMVDLSAPDAERLDLADRADLAAGVRFLAGEARARHVHVDRAGEAADVLARWRAALGHAAWVASRDEAIDEGWFGPRGALRPPVLERIGDVVVAAHGRLGIFQRLVDPGEASLAGHHGSLTSAEVLVPWIVAPAG